MKIKIDWGQPWEWVLKPAIAFLVPVILSRLIL